MDPDLLEELLDWAVVLIERGYDLHDVLRETEIRYDLQGGEINEFRAQLDIYLHCN